MVSHPRIVAAATAVVIFLLMRTDGGDSLLLRTSAIWNSLRGGPPQRFYSRGGRLRINSETSPNTIVPDAAELIPFSEFERAAEMKNVMKEGAPLSPGFEG